MGGSDDCYFLYAVVTVNDLMANSNDVNLAKIRYVHFSLLRNCRFVFIEQRNSTTITRIGKFYHLFAPRNAT